MPIPKVIYQTWKTKDLPPTVQKVRDDIQALNPDYKMVLYDDAEMDTFMKMSCDEAVYKIYSNLNVGAAKADFWRYCVLYKYGGVYLDIDSTIIKPLDELILENDQCIITREGSAGIFNNWIMVFDKHHPILRMAITICCHNILNKVTRDICHLTGPHGPFTNAINIVMLPFYNKNTNLYFEKDEDLNSILNNPKYDIRARFYGMDMEKFVLFKHDYTDDLYKGHTYWRQEYKIFKN